VILDGGLSISNMLMIQFFLWNTILKTKINYVSFRATFGSEN
jgi:hypothetical protein